MARKVVDFGKDNWYGTPVNVYLEDDGTYTFEYGSSGNLDEVKKGLTKDAAIKMLKDKTNGPRYNSRACNSTNPVVANAMRASGGVARNADEIDGYVEDLVKGFRREYLEILGNAMRGLESLAKTKVASAVEEIKKENPGKRDKLVRMQNNILQVNAMISRATGAV